MFSMSTRKTKIWMSILLSVGAILVIGGAVLLILFPKILENKIKENLILKEGTPTFDKWVESPVPIYLRIYFFNVTNPDEILVNGSKPELEEIGPFTFKEMRKKIVTGWDNEAGSVHYINQKYFYFDEEKSAQPLDTLITTVNIPLLTISKLVDEKVSFLFRGVAYSAINGYKNDTLFIKRTASQLLFEGFRIDIVADALKAIQSFLSSTPPFKSHFGFLYNKNGSQEEYYSVYTGRKGIENYTNIHTFLNESSLSYWHNEYCNMLNGTDGKQFPFPLSREQNIMVFSPELCRSLWLKYESDVDIENINAYRYTARAELFARNAENKGYCTDPKNCPLDGVHQVSLCKKGAPIVISAPHFFLADPSYYEAFEGLNPNQEDHETRLDVEPQTGVTLQAKRRIMISAEIKGNKMVNNLRKAPTMIFPAMWTEQSARIPTDLADKFIAKVKRPGFIATIILSVAIILGSIWVIIGTFMAVNLWLRPNEAGSTPKKDPTMAVSYTAVATQPPAADNDLPPKTVNA